MKTWEVKHAGRDDADFVEVLKANLAWRNISSRANWKNFARWISISRK
jgi:hypothetical protein